MSSHTETVRYAVAHLRKARFVRICQYTVRATGERTSISRGQVDLRTGAADLELPLPAPEGSASHEVAMVLLRPPHGYLRRSDGTWLRLGERDSPVTSESVTGTLLFFESEALSAARRADLDAVLAFDVRVDVQRAIDMAPTEVKPSLRRAARTVPAKDGELRGTVWISDERYIQRIELPGRAGGIAGAEFYAVGRLLALVPVPEDLT
jgi:hypothetical protein